MMKTAQTRNDDAPFGERLIAVRRQWNDRETATYRLKDIDGLHMSDLSGGVQTRAPRPFLHGYVLCNAMVDGSLPHSCSHGPPPHSIKVCITKKDNPRNYGALFEWAELLEQLRICPFAVDLGLTSDRDSLAAWLDGAMHVLVDGPGWWPDEAAWSKRGRPQGPQIWFNDPQTATEFARHFGFRLLHHQNVSKQHAAALFMAPREAG